MPNNYQCPRYGQALKYVSKFQEYYCDRCMFFPLTPPGPVPLYSLPKPPYAHPPSPFTARRQMLLILAIPFIFVFVAAALYPLATIPLVPNSTPQGTMDFTESGETYYGNFVQLSRNVSLSDTSLTVCDNSEGTAAFMNPIVSGGSATIDGGMNCSYLDINQNREIDGGDVTRVCNADSGDTITFIYLLTGGVIAEYTFV